VHADFDHDGFGDLAVSASASRWMENDGDAPGPEAGVHVLYGSSNGLAPDRNQYLTTSDIGSGSGTFGASLATGDFNGDGFTDLAIGDAFAGQVGIVFGSPRGLTMFGTQVWSQATPWIVGTE
jgi:hypothetical protein